MTKILIWDIEMSGCLAHVWGTGEQYIRPEQLRNDKFIISISYKWYGEEEVYNLSLTKKQIKDRNDSSILAQFSKILNSADWHVYHNGDSFDLKEVNTRLVKHGLSPVLVANSVDTWKACKKYFRFQSNKLGEVCKWLGLEEKIDTGGLDLWLRICYGYDMVAYEEMLDYNDQDVLITEALFERLLPFLKLTKKLNSDIVYDKKDLNRVLAEEECNNCGTIGGHKVRSHYVTATGKIRFYYACGHCGAHGKLSKVFKNDNY